MNRHQRRGQPQSGLRIALLWYPLIVLGIVALIALLAGCAPSSSGWQRSGSEPSQLERDHHECEMRAESVTGPPTPQYGLLGVWGNRSRVRDLHAKCMKARGWIKAE